MSFISTAEYEKILYNQDNSPFVYDLNRRVNSKIFTNLAWHEEIEIKYIVSGTLGIRLGTKMIRAKKGDIVIINPFEYHANVIEEGEDAVYHLLCVNLSRIFSGKLFETDFILDSRLHMRFKNLITDDEEMRGYADALFSSFEKNDSLLSLGSFISFFSALKNHVDPDANMSEGKDSRNSEIINAAFSYIHAHFDEHTKLCDIAKECYVSEPHFCRVFKSVTGETPIAYINSLKISKAISLMKNSTLTIKQISAAVGFDDDTYFCRCFKKKTGFSPRMYMKEQNTK